MGRDCPLCPNTLDVNLFSNFEVVVDFDAEISDRAFNLGMPKKQLDRSQVAGPLVDHRCFGSPQ